jgi:hypothetical protein
MGCTYNVTKLQNQQIFVNMITYLKDVMSLHVIRRIYFAYFHTHLRYGLVFWGGDSENIIIFKLQKWVIEIGVSRYMACRQLFKDLNIFPVTCMYISEIISHIKLHTEKLEQNAAIHNHNT